MKMKKQTISKTLLTVMFGAVMVSGSAMAESMTDKVETTADSTGNKIDSSMNKVGNFMDDSSITAKVKAALVDSDTIKSNDISVKTDDKVVTLSGMVDSQAQIDSAVALTKKVEGVKSVNNELKVK
ncbi:BON domain-containing protein [Yokenella regensburgei]|jgi:hyperosmotically inducible protein|uniref:BON domain-containing protein n=1 Tax=Yokenella regensburgei TaxID=158877 RepID=A0ABX9RVB2_9ENTR|nr:phospholipid-binding domain protein [Yokenella regensburgei ATCC 43003]RKR53963.1 BON domain-containing protein [Yokenella regensburgei]VFS24020.1 Osmotically-inducible protein Y precursor [Yokenella regensburgei]